MLLHNGPCLPRDLHTNGQVLLADELEDPRYEDWFYVRTPNLLPMVVDIKEKMVVGGKKRQEFEANF